MRLSTARIGFFFALVVGNCLGVVSAKDANQASAAAGKHLLQYKFAMGDVLRYDVRHATHTRNTADGSTDELDTRSDSVKTWKVTDVLPSGEMEFIHVVEWLRMTNEKPGGPRNLYDSRTDPKPPRIFEQVAHAVGVPLSVVRIAPSGEVTFREEKHPHASSDDMPITLRLPENPVSIGEKWSHQYNVSEKRKSGANIQVQTRRVCKLRQVQNGVAVIDVEYQILTPVDAFVRSNLVHKLTDGTVRFDIDRGRIVEQEHNVDQRVLGFASKASSMHYVSRLSEKLIKTGDASDKIRQASANLPE